MGLSITRPETICRLGWESQRVVAGLRGCAANPAYMLVIMAALLMLAACASMSAKQRLASLQDGYENALDKALFYQTAGLLAPDEEARLSSAFDTYELAITSARAAIGRGDTDAAQTDMDRVQNALAAAEAALLIRAQRRRE